MAGQRWLFTKEELSKTPSIKHGYAEEMESAYRQNCANLIQNMGQRLALSQLCMNTAIVYMHRFYMFHALQKFNWRSIAAACLFLSAKVEEQPKKMEHIIKAGHYFGPRDKEPLPPLEVGSTEYLSKAQDLVINENVLLQTLGFNVTIEHSSTHIIKLCKLVKVPKELSQLSYFLSTNSLLLTNMCLQYSPEVIAAVSIHLGCKWKDWEFQSREGKLWWQYVAPELSSEKLEEVTKKFLTIMEKADPKLKKELMSKLQMSADSSPNSRSNSPAPHRPSPAPHRPSPHHNTAHRSHPHTSQHHSGHHPPSDKAHKPSSSSSETGGPPAKTYAEHRERSRTSTPTSDPSSSKSRPLHGESPLVRGDKRPHPKDSHSTSHSNSSSKTNNISPHPAQGHNPYNQPRNHEKSSRHHHRHHTSSSDGSPMKKPRTSSSENGNGESKRPPLPPQPPQPRPPPPPT